MEESNSEDGLGEAIARRKFKLALTEGVGMFEGAHRVTEILEVLQKVLKYSGILENAVETGHYDPNLSGVLLT